ncbi:MAG: DUF3465 domain-containing protein [Burkholderiales bacterium]|nr:DUF3465 domain-containing protein [Burkholderiales bacterium]MDR4516810.1 DUF3465 domain-containing protein [Nitrosomonas sp.]
MKFFTLLFLTLIPGISVAENSLINSNKLFNFVEAAYPDFFSPAGVETTPLYAYLVRYYPETDTYIGTKDEEVYVFGNVFGGLLRAGVIPDFIESKASSDELLAQLFASAQSNVQVFGVGTVISILSDELDGTRHQRFIIELKSKQTLLIAHNIDLAPRIDTLEINDSIEFFGEYEWNDKGGVIHWTHHDPEEIHVNGWLFHKNAIYQ